MQNCSNSIASALELLQSCTKSSTFCYWYQYREHWHHHSKCIELCCWRFFWWQAKSRGGGNYTNCHNSVICKFFRLVTYWVSYSYLSGVTADKLWWHLSNMMWFEGSNRYFRAIRDISNKEINKEIWYIVKETLKIPEIFLQNSNILLNKCIWNCSLQNVCHFVQASMYWPGTHLWFHNWNIMRINFAWIMAYRSYQ